MADLTLNRRAMLAGSAALLLAPRITHAAALPETDKRLVFIIQRGAADGLHCLAPMGDPAYAALRQPMLGSLQGATPLDSLFWLHPSLKFTAGLFASGQAMGVHALASAYRERSHFDGQNILETGGLSAYAEHSGWMNRLVGLLPGGQPKALALAPDIPMALRGSLPVGSFAPSGLPKPGDELLHRVARMYAPDAPLAAIWAQTMATKAMVGDLANAKGQAPADTGKLAAALLGGADGARLLMIETGGWDTHTGQTGRLAGQLQGLDRMVEAMATGLGSQWANTMVLIATEFGRTAAVNGTQGTDHGTGSAAFVLGGGLATTTARAGKVLADWPGLAPDTLYEKRDLRPTTATEALIAGLVAQHFGLDPALVARKLYPAQATLRALEV